jgi:hypothetical protein
LIVSRDFFVIELFLAFFLSLDFHFLILSSVKLFDSSEPHFKILSFIPLLIQSFGALNFFGCSLLEGSIV